MKTEKQLMASSPFPLLHPPLSDFRRRSEAVGGQVRLREDAPARQVGAASGGEGFFERFTQGPQETERGPTLGDMLHRFQVF